jgi:hypothetical protein
MRVCMYACLRVCVYAFMHVYVYACMHMRYAATATGKGLRDTSVAESYRKNRGMVYSCIVEEDHRNWADLEEEVEEVVEVVEVVEVEVEVVEEEVEVVEEVEVEEAVHSTTIRYAAPSCNDEGRDIPSPSVSYTRVSSRKIEQLRCVVRTTSVKASDRGESRYPSQRADCPPWVRETVPIFPSDEAMLPSDHVKSILGSIRVRVRPSDGESEAETAAPEEE